MIKKIIASWSTIYFLTVLVLITTATFAQETSKARLVEESQNDNAEGLEEKLDLFAIELYNTPNANAEIIVFRDKNTPLGFPIRYGVRIKTYLSENRGFDLERLKIVDGGLALEPKAQLWITPQGAEPVSVTDKSEIDFRKTFLYDSFFYQTPEDVGSCCVTNHYGDYEKAASLDAFAELLKKDANNGAYLVFYSFKCKKNCGYHRSADSPKLANLALKREKQYLVEKHGIDLSNIITVNGGRKLGDFPGESRRLQLWFVPKNGEVPKFTNLSSKRNGKSRTSQNLSRKTKIAFKTGTRRKNWASH